MKETRFIDTSILLEILEVPGKCNNSKTIQAEFAHFAQQSQATIIMPISVLIETGNHVNHIKSNPKCKKKSVEKFNDILAMFIKNKSPWSFYGYDFKEDDIKRIAERYGRSVFSGIGIGDIFIIDSYNAYVDHLKMDKHQNHKIKIWSLDKHLSSHEIIL